MYDRKYTNVHIHIYIHTYKQICIHAHNDTRTCVRDRTYIKNFKPSFTYSNFVAANCEIGMLLARQMLHLRRGNGNDRNMSAAILSGVHLLKPCKWKTQHVIQRGVVAEVQKYEVDMYTLVHKHIYIYVQQHT